MTIAYLCPTLPTGLQLAPSNVSGVPELVGGTWVSYPNGTARELVHSAHDPSGASEVTCIPTTAWSDGSQIFLWWVPQAPTGRARAMRGHTRTHTRTHHTTAAATATATARTYTRTSFKQWFELAGGAGVGERGGGCIRQVHERHHFQRGHLGL